MTKKQKEYRFQVTLVFDQTIEAKSKAEAMEELKTLFAQEWGLDITDDEIKLIKQ